MPVTYKNEEQIKVWEKIIDVQMHFNEIKSKNQTLFISVITASLAATGYFYSTKSGDHIFSLFNLTFHTWTFPLFFSVFFTLAFYVLDYGIYQTLLKGAVECGKWYEDNVLTAKLTSHFIEDHSSQHKFFGLDCLMGARRKLQLFYGIFFFVFLLSFIFSNLS